MTTCIKCILWNLIIFICLWIIKLLGVNTVQDYVTQLHKAETLTSLPQHAAKNMFLLHIRHSASQQTERLQSQGNATHSGWHFFHHRQFQENATNLSFYDPYLNYLYLELVCKGAANSRVRRCILIQWSQFQARHPRAVCLGSLGFNTGSGCYNCLHVYEL